MSAPTSEFGRLLSAFASEFDRLDDGVVDVLLTEMIPGLATLLLDEWEVDLGLPESCMPQEDRTLAERRIAAHSKYTRKISGLSEQFYIDLAASLGISIEIIVGGGVGTPFRVNDPAIDPDETRVGPFTDPDDPAARLWSAERIHTWYVKYYTSGGTDATLETMKCYIRQLKPAHTVVEFIPVASP